MGDLQEGPTAAFQGPQGASGPNLYAEALAYARGGVLVFPCASGPSGGKEPLTAHGFKDASADEVQIRAWWSQHPTANIGAPTGVNGWTVLDIDTDDRGEISRIAEGLQLPRTAMVRTGRGYHIYFGAVEGVRPSVSIMAHVDVRSGESYVILPPSVHESGRAYRWQVPLSEITDMPPGTRVKLTRADGVPADPNLTGRKLVKGERRPELFRVVRVFQSRGVGDDTALAQIRLINAARCDPPLPEEELVKLVRGGAKYGREGAVGEKHKGRRVIGDRAW